MDPAEPSNVASPNAKTPPSPLAIRYPPPSGVATPEKTGEFNGWGTCGSFMLTLPKPIIPPSLYTAPAGTARVTAMPAATRSGTSSPAQATTATVETTRRPAAATPGARPCRPVGTPRASPTAHEPDCAPHIGPAGAGAVTKLLRIRPSTRV